MPPYARLAAALALACAAPAALADPGADREKAAAEWQHRVETEGWRYFRVVQRSAACRDRAPRALGGGWSVSAVFPELFGSKVPPPDAGASQPFCLFEWRLPPGLPQAQRAEAIQAAAYGLREAQLDLKPGRLFDPRVSPLGVGALRDAAQQRWIVPGGFAGCSRRSPGARCRSRSRCWTLTRAGWASRPIRPRRRWTPAGACTGRWWPS